MSGYKLMYHIGPTKPIPQSNALGWIRPQFSGPMSDPVVFLTHRWERVWANHGKRGNVYIFKVPYKVISVCGLRTYGDATEIIIPEHLWPECIFVGKIDSTKAKKIINRGENVRQRSGGRPGSCFEDSPNSYSALDGLITRSLEGRNYAKAARKIRRCGYDKQQGIIWGLRKGYSQR